MKRNSKRRHPFVLVYFEEDDTGTTQTYFVDMLQSPKCPERYAHYWAIKKVRDWLKQNNIPFKEWQNYMLYPVNRFNCSQFGNSDTFYDHIHVADYPEEDDKLGIEWYNNIKSRYACQIK